MMIYTVAPPPGSAGIIIMTATIIAVEKRITLFIPFTYMKDNYNANIRIPAL
jgi:hypothetical protein